jgi:hypothetical protein
MYENQEVLSEMFTFFHSQQDQIRSIYFDTQDEYFHHLLTDPSNGTNHLIPHIFHESNTQGVGLMYRVLDAEKFMESVSEHDFNGMNLSLTVKVVDTFHPDNDKIIYMKIEDGKLVGNEAFEAEVTIELNVSDFSSMLMGVVPFDALHTYGKTTISDPTYISKVTRLFYTHQKPVCLNRF